MLQENISIHKMPGARSEALKLGDFIYISGILPVDEKNRLVSTNIEEQIEQVMKNLGMLLKECDLNYSHIMKLGIQLTDLDNLLYVDEAIRRIFKNPYPARTVTGVDALCYHAGIQIDGIAVDTRALEILCSGEEDDEEECDGKCCTFRK